MSYWRHHLALAALIFGTKATFAACPEKIMNISPMDYTDCKQFYDAIPDTTWLDMLIHLVPSEPSNRRIWVDSLFLKYDFRETNRITRLPPPPDSNLHQDQQLYWMLYMVRVQQSTVKRVVTESFVRYLELGIGEPTTSIRKLPSRTVPTPKFGSHSYDANGRVLGKEGRGISHPRLPFHGRPASDHD